ncbi:MAG: hypothetical protein IMY67_02940 [Bacteroidetes bacterium]|nr:hypothetical protein [Bacteroidota bacterium]
MTNTNKPNTVFWIIAIIALIWNLFGVFAYLGQAFMTDEVLALMPQGDQDYHNNVPAWVTAAFAIAVFAGVLGCIGLLMRKKWSKRLFMLSLIAVLVQSTYNFFIQEYVDLSGEREYMPIMIILVAAFLVWYSKNVTVKGWLS